MSAKLTAKETALLTAVGAKYFSFFDDGIVAGSGIWVGCLTEEIAGNATYPVSETVRGAATVAASLARKGYAEIGGDGKVGDDDAPWFTLTELGAETANELAAPASPVIPEPAPVIPEDAPKPKKTRKAKAAPVIAEEAPAPAPVIPAEADNFTTKTWSDETADYGTEEWIRWDFSDGSYAERRRRQVSGAWRTDFWGAAADGKRVFTLSGVAKAARQAGKFTA